MSRPFRKKSGVCRYFSESGTCHYGDKCQYAHVGTSNGYIGAVGAPSSAFSRPSALRGGRGREAGSLANVPPDGRGSYVSMVMGDHQFNMRHSQHLPSQGLPNELVSQMNNLHLATGPGPLPPHKTYSQRHPTNRNGEPGGAGAFSFQFMSRPGRSVTVPSHGMGMGMETQERHKLGVPNMSATPKRLRAPNKANPKQMESVGGTTYYVPQNTQLEHLPEYSYYSGMPSHLVSGRGTQVQSVYPNADIVEELTKSQLLSLAQLPQDNPSVPTEVDHYHSLFPLEAVDATPPERQAERTFGYSSTCYKAIDARDGLLYVLRRIHGFKLSSTKAVNEVAKWKKIRHSNIVSLREMFTTKSFGDNSLVFVYDYHAGADTLLMKHFHVEGSEGLGGPAVEVKEDTLWQYIIQISSALTAIHSSGLAVRFIDASKVLVSRKSRVRLNSVGIMDILRFEGNAAPQNHIPRYQQEDLVAFGHLLVCLATGNLSGHHGDNYNTAMNIISKKYQKDLVNLIQYLLQAQSMPHTISGVMPFMGLRMMNVLEGAWLYQDQLENELIREADNGRLFRMLAKMGAVNERPEFHQDPNWSETGDRYLLKLFRDYLFHQITPSGTPWLDLAHIVQSLNKLDAGSQERICLYSREGETVLIVSFAELRHCLEVAFSEVLNSSTTASSTQEGDYP